MTLAVIVLALLLLVAVAVARAVRTDGYGSTPPLPSQYPLDPRLPSRPYALR